MNYDFKRTFDGVKLTDKRQEEMKAALSSRFSEQQKENLFMSEKTYSCKKQRVLVIAVAVLLSLSLVGFAYGSQILRFFTGAAMVTEKSSSGNNIYKSLIVDSIEEKAPAEMIDQKIIFTLDGSNRDITEFCSEQDYFAFEFVDENKWKQVVVVGGTVENMGYSLFIFNENGEYEGGHGQQTGDGLHDFGWYTKAKEKYIGEILER